MDTKTIRRTERKGCFTMNELNKQILETKIEYLKEVKANIIAGLKKDDRTSIYINFIDQLERHFNELIVEEERKL